MLNFYLVIASPRLMLSGVLKSTLIAMIMVAPLLAQSSAVYTGLDANTQGGWTGRYGADGNIIADETAAPPSYATVKFSGNNLYTWASSTSDPRALQTTGGASSRIASTYYSYGNFSINVDLTDGKTHRVALYLLDWDSTTRTESIQIVDAGTNAVLDSESFSGFHNGAYATWNISGNVIIKLTKTGGSNAVVAGLFFDPVPAAATVNYIGVDTTTQGTWTRRYGSNGGVIANDSSSSQPTVASITFSGNKTFTWSASSTDLRALQIVSNSILRIASTYYSYGSFDIRVNVTDGNTHKISLYLLDWDTTARAESIEILDANSGAVLDTETYSGFNNGEWAAWNIKGNVVIQVTTTGGVNAVVSGVFVD